jgi:hypothetical protein
MNTRFWLIASDDLYVESVGHVTHAIPIRSGYLPTSLSRLVKPFVHTLFFTPFGPPSLFIVPPPLQGIVIDTFQDVC